MSWIIVDIPPPKIFLKYYRVWCWCHFLILPSWFWLESPAEVRKVYINRRISNDVYPYFNELERVSVNGISCRTCFTSFLRYFNVLFPLKRKISQSSLVDGSMMFWHLINKQTNDLLQLRSFHLTLNHF